MPTKVSRKADKQFVSWAGYVWKAVLILALTACFIKYFDIANKSVRAFYHYDSDVSMYRALNWLKDNSAEGDVVLSNWMDGNQVVALARRPTVATSKVYPSEIEMVAERYRDIKKFFGAVEEEQAMKIIKKYGVKYVFLDKGEEKGNKILTWMREGMPLTYFNKIYDSGRHVIYAVRDGKPRGRETGVHGTAYEQYSGQEYEDLLTFLKSKVSAASRILTNIIKGKDMHEKLGSFVVSPGGEEVRDENGGEKSSEGFVLKNADISKFLFAQSEDESMDIVKSHRIDYVVLAKEMPQWLLRYAGKEGVVIAGNRDLSFLGNQITLYGRMRRSQKFNHYQIEYTSKSFVVYRVKQASRPVHFTRFFGWEEMIKSYFSDKGVTVAQDIYGVIVSHGDRELGSIARGIEKLATSSNLKTVIVLAPNVYSLVNEDALTSLRSFETPFGRLDVDRRTAKEVMRGDIVKIGDQALEVNSALGTILPFLKYKLPGVKFVPVLVRPSMPQETAAALSEMLSESLRPGTVLLAVMNLTHKYPRDAALMHEKDAVDALIKLEKDKAYDLKVDSPSGLYILLDCMQRKGAGSVDVFDGSGYSQVTDNNIIGFQAVFAK